MFDQCEGILSEFAASLFTQWNHRVALYDNHIAYLSIIVNNSANSLSKSSHRIIAFALARVKGVTVEKTNFNPCGCEGNN